MSDAALSQSETPRGWHFEWVLPLFFRPRRTFAKIASQPIGVWLAPMFILTLAALAGVLSAGWVKQAAALSGEVQLPPDFQYYPPEMQAQYMQAMQATSSPVFLYVFPAIVSLGGVWIGWLLVSGLLHLLLTLMGGRGDTLRSLNVVAWAGITFALRDIVRTIYILITRHLISSPGLSGFAPPVSEGWVAYLAKFSQSIDIYLIWNLILLVIGVRAATNLGWGKAIASVVITLLVVLSLQALVGFLVSQLGGMTVIRPFF
jgi:hypothetical protein